MRSSSCSFEQPLRCPDGRCVRMLVQCASIQCPPDHFLSCPDNTCRGEISQCRYPLSTNVVGKSKIRTGKHLQTINLLTVRGKTAGGKTVGGKTVGYLMVRQEMALFIEGFSASDFAQTKLAADEKFAPVFLNFMAQFPADVPPLRFIRSAR